jgi:xanthine dehydrogenase accessory factor
MMSGDWLEALARSRSQGMPAVLVTVASAEGSAPREAGAKMVVTADGLFGTIGGGTLEFQAAARARALLEAGASAPVLEELPLGPALGQCCGGRVVLLLEPVRPPARTLYLFGAGHVGREVADVLGGVPDLRLVWIDGREGQFPDVDAPPGERRLVSEQPESEVPDAPAGSLFLVMTHSHDLDFRLVETILRRDDFSWLGLIGSETKCARFARRLAAKGLDPARMVCPIGIPGIAGKHPRVIAVSVAAQILGLMADLPLAK